MKECICIEMIESTGTILAWDALSWSSPLWIFHFQVDKFCILSANLSLSSHSIKINRRQRYLWQTVPSSPTATKLHAFWFALISEMYRTYQWSEMTSWIQWLQKTVAAQKNLWYLICSFSLSNKRIHEAKAQLAPSKVHGKNPISITQEWLI